MITPKIVHLGYEPNVYPAVWVRDVRGDRLYDMAGHRIAIKASEVFPWKTDNGRPVWPDSALPYAVVGNAPVGWMPKDLTWWEAPSGEPCQCCGSDTGVMLDDGSVLPPFGGSLPEDARVIGFQCMECKMHQKDRQWSNERPKGYKTIVIAWSEGGVAQACVARVTQDKIEAMHGGLYFEVNCEWSPSWRWIEVPPQLC